MTLRPALLAAACVAALSCKPAAQEARTTTAPTTAARLASLTCDASNRDALFIIDSVAWIGVGEEVATTLPRSSIEIIAEVVKGAEAVERFGACGTGGVVVIRVKPDAPPAVLSLLTSHVPGVTSTPPDAAGRIAIRFGERSAAAKLVVVDGVPLRPGGEPASALSPEDIVSVEVVKAPAATGRFGRDAAQGAVLITTLRGVETL